MATKHKYGRTSMFRMLGVSVAFEIDAVHSVLSLGTEKFDEETNRLQERWAEALADGSDVSEHVTDYLVDERDVLETYRQELGYAVAILLCSVIEGGISSIQERLEKTGRPAPPKRHPGKGFLKSYIDFHRERCGTDFSVPVKPLGRRGDFVPDGLEEKLEYVDGQVLHDFVWLRNKVVHERGRVKEAQLKGRVVEAVPRAAGLELVASHEYLTKAMRHALAFFDIIFEDLRRVLETR